MSRAPRILAAAVALSVAGASAAASAADEPGLRASPGEPGPRLRGPRGTPPRVTIAAAFGYASLVVDPDVGEGYGGGLDVTWWLIPRLGVEASAFVSANPYGIEGITGVAATFLAGNIDLGLSVKVTPPRWRLAVTATGALGAYLVVPALQPDVWSLGVAFGAAVSYRITPWLGVGAGLRYHLFNLARFSGPELRGLRFLSPVGVLDRLEIPVRVLFFI